MNRRVTYVHIVWIGNINIQGQTICRGKSLGNLRVLRRTLIPLVYLLMRSRHVRVHHVDKDKDDPQLREVLAQRPEGPSRGRRRRGGNN
jgi:hypothetical protein